MHSIDSEIAAASEDQQLPASENMNQHAENFVCCEECDVVYKRIELKKGEKAYCLRCGAGLYKNGRTLEQLLPLVIASLIMFAISNAYPIVQIELQGIRSETTLFGAVLAMFQEGRGLVALLVLFTTIIFPLCELLLLLYILISLNVLKTKPIGMAIALRIIRVFRIWGMIEVFLIGVLVTLVKLVVMVTIIPGIALWSFAILTVLMVLVISVKVSDIWDQVEKI
ncbi:MAG: paraquat-inducible protein A [Candidatus Saccharibacteria bacterium]|nr:paraquat-inducible protein A [Moraxellaceae bacterium]